MKIFILLLVSSALKGQIQTLDLNSAGIGNNGAVRYFNPTAKGDNTGLAYSEIRGRYFWNDEWKPASVVLKKGQTFKLNQVKLNLYSKEIHYLNDKSQELVAESRIIKSIHFFNQKDSAQNVTFENIFFNDEEFLMQVLARGKAQFLKRLVVTLHKGAYDPMLGKSDVRFVSSTDYFVKLDSIISPLKNLNKEALISITHLTPELEKWLSSNKNKLKKEPDFISFFDFYNKEN